MYRINNITITGFWNKYTIKTDFFKNVNIFIGKNGTGKTTFMNLLQAVFILDIETLVNIQFSKIVLNLRYGKRVRKITVTKSFEKDTPFNSLNYQISSKKYIIPVSNSVLRYRGYNKERIHPRTARVIDEAKQALSELVNLSFLSVHREDIYERESYSDRSREQNPVDNKLKRLMRQLTRHQLLLESKITKLSKNFQADVLKTMLFNEEFDFLKIDKTIEIDYEEITNSLKHAYLDLEILDDTVTSIIEKHVEAISKAVININKWVKSKDEGLFPNDVTPLTLFRRTEKIIKLSSALEDKKDKVLKMLNKYIKLLKDFIKDKNFSMETSAGGLTVKRGRNSFPITMLSSGEKQLLILLTETLLQMNKRTIFIADEPELSLHISWQKRIVPSIYELNSNAQIILATHSPEIVGKWKTNAISMENIING